MSTAPSHTWWTAAELAEARLPGLPTTKRRINALAERECWQAAEGKARRRAGRGGGWEYHWHLLPLSARTRLVPATTAAEIEARDPLDRTGAYAAWDNLPEATKDEARRRFEACSAIAALQDAGQVKNVAVHAVGRKINKSARTLWNWLGLLEGIPREDWLVYLPPRRGGIARPDQRAHIPDRFMDLLKADYLRLETPSFTSAYRRVVGLAKEERINAIPAEHLARRRLNEIVPKVTMIYMREGEAGLSRCYPPQIRDRSGLAALEAVNADCHKFDVFVRWPGAERVERPQVIVFQDVFSGKILSWRIDHSPNKVMVMAAWADLIRDWGIPKHCLFDNGREFANKWLTGGAATRFRFKVREGEPLGALTMLGVKIHWATPAHGQAKPVERSFRDLSEDIAKDPRFAGAYVGRRPDAKPENYMSTAVDLETFVAVVGEGIDAHNARTGRTSHTCAGRSFDATFAASYGTARVTKAGRDRAGCDCWGLARLVYAEQLGITLPDYVSAYPSADEHAEVARLIDGEVLAEGWIPEATPRPFDLIVFRLGRWGSHIGIAERAGLMLHMEGEDTCKIARLADARWSRRMVSAIRHPLLQGGFE